MTAEPVAPGPAAQALALGDALRDAGWTARAEQTYLGVLREHPGNAAAPYRLALLYEAHGKQLEAMAALRVTLDADPGLVGAHLAMGRILALNRQTAATACYRRALAVDPANTDALLGCGGLGGPFGVFRWALALAPDDPTVLRHVAGVHLALGDPRTAETCLRAALAGDPACAEAHMALGDALRAQARTAEAAEAYGEAVARKPDLLPAQLGLGAALHALGRGDEALAGLRDAATALAGNDTARMRIAGLLFEQGRDEDAFALYRDYAERFGDRGRYPGHAPRRVRVRPAADVCRERGWPYRVVAPAGPLRVTGGDGVPFDYDLPEVFLAYAEDARVVPRLFAPLIGDALLIDGFNTNSRVSLTMLPHLVWHSPDGHMLVDLTEPEVSIGGEAVLLGGGPNWSHGVLDWASKLAVLERFPDLSGLPVLVSADTPGSILDLMELLGLERGRVVPMPPAAVLAAERLWLPSLTHDYQRMAPLHVDFLRRRLAGPMAAGLAGPRRRLFLSRRHAAYRRLLNEEEVLAALAPLGVEPVVPDGMDIAGQIALFASAELIVGPIGGGSAAIAFAPPGASYVELVHPHIALDQYRTLTGLLGQRFRQIVGEAAGNRTTNVFDHDFTVPPDAVVAAARALLDGNDP